MLPMFSIFKNISYKTLIIAVALSVSSMSYCTAADKEKVIDLSILERQSVLEKTLLPAQRIEISKAQALIDRGASDIRTGTHLKQQKPSAFKSKADIASDKKRGEQLLEQGKETIMEGQKIIVSILLEAEKAQKKGSERIAKKHESKLTYLPYAEALHNSAIKILEDSRKAGYSTVLFDGIHLNSGKNVVSTSIEVRNEAYDVYVKADGTRFSVTVPVNLMLSGDDKASLTYENEAAFSNEQIALLIIEIIAEEASNEGTLFVRAIDVETFKILSTYIVPVTDFPAIPVVETDIVDNKDSNETTTPGEMLNTSVIIDLDQRLVQQIGKLVPPYRFSLQSQDFSSAIEENKDGALTLKSLIEHSNFFFVDHSFVEQVYGKEGQNLDYSHNAVFTIGAQGNTEPHLLTARAGSSSKVIEIGTIRISLSDSE